MEATLQEIGHSARLLRFEDTLVNVISHSANVFERLLDRVVVWMVRLGLLDEIS